MGDNKKRRRKREGKRAGRIRGNQPLGERYNRVPRRLTADKGGKRGFKGTPETIRIDNLCNPRSRNGKRAMNVRSEKMLGAQKAR